jgi:endo-1,4-beta-mannosidase
MNDPMGKPFLLGINLAVGGRFEEMSREQIGEDMARVANLGAKATRLPLPWHELQPAMGQVPDRALRWLEMFFEEALAHDLRVIPVFFCWQWADSNWLPAWMCETTRSPTPKPLDFYRERDLIHAQQLQLEVVVGAFGKHQAVLGWDLGRETSTLAPAPDPDAARSRLLWLVEALKKEDEEHPVTYTLSQSDLEVDRGLRPKGLAEELDFLSIQVSSETAPWSPSPAGPDTAGFLVSLARALSAKPVLVAELGMGGTAPADDMDNKPRSEKEEEQFYEEWLESARQCGALGGLAWYLKDVAVSAGSVSEPSGFGLLRENGAQKPVAESFWRYASSAPGCVETTISLAIDEASFYANPEARMKDAYEEFRRARESEQSS